MNVILFFKVLAWVVAVVSVLMFSLKLYMQLSYTELEKLIDRTKGFQKNYAAGNLKYAIGAIIAIAFLIAA